jgi:hypothetical protein
MPIRRCATYSIILYYMKGNIMLGVEYQTIYCDVKKCKYNEKHTAHDGKTRKVCEVYHTCEKSTINITKTGRCRFATAKVLP